jgi:hypothetical protein
LRSISKLLRVRRSAFQGSVLCFPTPSRAFASQAAAYVIDVGATLSADGVPEKYRGLVYEQLGESRIIDPTGEVIAGPAQGETILVAEGSMKAVYKAKAFCDVAGHYSRPDVFQLRVNKEQRQRVVEQQDPNREVGEPGDLEES